MRSTQLRPMLLAAALVLLGAFSAAAQSAPAAGAFDPEKVQDCATLADTARNLPRPTQIAERVALRDTLVRIGRRFGVAQPQGLLFVAVDTGTMRGVVRFLDTNLPDTAVHVATRLVERYLSTLTPGRGFQMLVRIDGDYPAMAAGKRLCQPAVADDADLHRMMRVLLDRHPAENRPRPGETRTAVLRLVVDHAGRVLFVHVEQPTGDAFYDTYLEELATRIRFHPARLDGQPFDTRIRYTLAFTS